MDSFTAIIDTLGGPSAAARKIGTSPQNVQQMRYRDSIPARYWSAIVQELPSLTLADLASLAASRQRGVK